MIDPRQVLRQRLNQLLSEWDNFGMPTRSGFQTAAEEMIKWRKKTGVAGLWENPPLMLTATIDDGWGHGLQLIHLWAKAIGLKLHSLGILKTAREIINKCRQLQPEILGMTVLQFDTEDDLILISRNLPSKTFFIAGGPIFSADPELASRSGIDYVASSAADFLKIMLRYEPAGN